MKEKKNSPTCLTVREDDAFAWSLSFRESQTIYQMQHLDTFSSSVTLFQESWLKSINTTPCCCCCCFLILWGYVCVCLMFTNDTWTNKMLKWDAQRRQYGAILRLLIVEILSVSFSWEVEMLVPFDLKNLWSIGHSILLSLRSNCQRKITYQSHYFTTIIIDYYINKSQRTHDFIQSNIFIRLSNLINT